MKADRWIEVCSIKDSVRIVSAFIFVVAICPVRAQGGPGFSAGRSIQDKESWVDRMIGNNGRTQPGDSRFYLSGAVAAGGFGVGSDGFSEVPGNIAYPWNESIGTTLGYRLCELDYQNGSLVYDVRQQGITMALTWSFRAPRAPSPVDRVQGNYRLSRPGWRWPAWQGSNEDPHSS